MAQFVGHLPMIYPWIFHDFPCVFHLMTRGWRPRSPLSVPQPPTAQWSMDQNPGTGPENSWFMASCIAISYISPKGGMIRTNPWIWVTIYQQILLAQFWATPRHSPGIATRMGAAGCCCLAVSQQRGECNSRTWVQRGMSMQRSKNSPWRIHVCMPY